MKSRKMRPHWMLVLGAGLCGSLVPACQLSGPPRSTWNPHPPESAAHAEASRQKELAQAPEPAAAPDYPRLSMAPPTRPKVEAATKPSGPDVITPAGAKAPRATAVTAAHPVAPNPAATQELLPDLEPKQGKVLLPPLPVMGPPATGGHAEEQDRTSNKLAEPPILAALRCYLNKRPDEALSCLKKYDPASQELLICLLPLAVQLAEGTGATGRQKAVALDQLESLLYPLRSRAPLVIDKMCFCKDIRTFGVYEPVPEDHVFHPGEHVQIYAELRNFSSERQETHGGRPVFVTRLASAVEVREDAKKLVWKHEFHRDNPDLSQTQRHDYFDHYDFWLPDLRPGWYKLEIIAEDVATQRKARRWLDLKVGLPAEGS